MTELSVVPFPVASGEDQVKVVELLRDLLTQAERGDVEGVAIAIVRPDQSFTTAWSATRFGSRLAGVIAYLQHRYCNELLWAKEIPGPTYPDAPA